jgi:RND family efflux transporter MFP subunit
MMRSTPARVRIALGAASLGAALLGAALLAACAQKEGDAAEDEAVPAVVGARTAVVAARPFTESVDAIGTVVARAGHVASLSVPTQGRVAQVLVSAGQRVTAGQPLVVLDRAQFEASAQSAEAAVQAAQQNADRTQRLLAEGIVPRKEAEQAQADLARARADLVGARRQEQLATVRAPIAGVVTRLNATLGSTADPAQPLVEIADPSALDILLEATPTDAARIQPGDKVALSAGQNAHGEPLGIGAVADIGAAVEEATRSVAVRVRVPAARRPLRIGETVFGEIAVRTVPNAVVVPTEALVPEGDGFKVFVVDAQNVAHARPVTVGARADSVAEITSGLTAGERIVTYGAYGLSDSAKVVPPEQAGRAPPEEKQDADEKKEKP